MRAKQQLCKLHGHSQPCSAAGQLLQLGWLADADETKRDYSATIQSGSVNCTILDSLDQGIQRRSCLLVQQQVVSLLQLRKLISRPRVVRVLVWMLHQRKLAVGLRAASSKGDEDC